MKNLLLLTCLWASCVGVTQAQNVLTYRCNSLRPDSVNKEIIPFFDAGCEGENVTWDFSDIELDERPDTTSLAAYCLSDKVLWDDNGTMTTYLQHNDSIVIVREETPLYEMDFDTPIARLVFPFQYGNTINQTFSGNGVYEGKLALNEQGVSSVVADAYGRLILNEGETINNVIRVHTVLESDIDVNYVSNNENIGMLHKTTDAYEWYAHGYRYPVLKVTSNQVKSGDMVLYSHQSAERMPPEMQLAYNDEYNEEVREQNAVSDSSRIENLNVQTRGGVATVSYCLTEDAHVQIALASSASIVYWTYSADENAGIEYRHDIPLTGLMRGQYGIHINVNGEIKECKINVL